jgi:hypothetical protein
MSIEMVKVIYNLQTSMPDDVNFYHRALEDIVYDGIASQVFYLLTQQGRLSQTPSFFHAQLKENYEKGLFQNLFIKNQTDIILKKFEGLGIDVIPLKGVYFAKEYFGHIGARATSDIDLLIRLDDLHRAIESVKSLGFTIEEEQIPGHFHCSYSKELPTSTMPLVVELHWNLVKENTSQFDINDLWSQAKQVGHFAHIKELSPNDTFYMICLHGWRHNLDSTKYFLDIIQMINNLPNEIDYNYILKLAKSHKTLKRMKRTLSIVYQQFPHLDQVIKFPLKIKNIKWEYRSTTGFKQYFDFIEYQFFSYDTVKHSIVEFHNWIWPSKYELSSQVGGEQKGKSFFKMYLSLYKKRIANVVKVFILH